MASRREEKEQRRQERLARERQDQEAARRRRLYSIVVGAILAIAAIAAVAVAVTTGGSDGAGGDSGGVPVGKGTFEGGTTPPPQVETDLVKAASAADCRLSNPVIEGRTHVADDSKKITYKTNPPTSGNHHPLPAGDGVYDRAPTATDLRHFVHTLEHGRIELQYDPALSKRQVDRLGGLYNEDPYHMVLFPNRRMPYRVAATAWGHLIGCKKVSDEAFDALRAFRDRYRDQGPEQAQ